MHCISLFGCVHNRNLSTITGHLHCVSVKSEGINSSRTKQIFIKFETREFKNFHIQIYAKYHTTLDI